MKIYCCQHDIVWENKIATQQRVQALLKAASPERGSLVLLPEMFSTGFSMNVAAVAEDSHAATEVFLAHTAKELGVFLLGGLVVSGTAGRGRNQAVLFSPEGKELARYTKMQPFSPGGETDHYAAGQEIVAFPWQGLTIAPFICYDLRFPELFRAAVRRGAQVFTVIANWPVARASHWVSLLQARAIENQAYVAGVNRVGKDPKLAYPGRSLLVSPSGEILADAEAKEGVISAEIDPDFLSKYRTGLPFLRDMRPDLSKLLS